MRILSALLALSLLAATSADVRTSELAAAFTKTKFKQKRGTSRYKEMHAEPVVRSDRASYSGAYHVSGMEYSLRVDVAANGRVTGSGDDDGRTYTLRDGRVDGALLTATKVYANGRTAPLEGIFMDLVDREGPAPERITNTARTFGFGVLLDEPLHAYGVEFQRLFYQR